MRRRWRSSSPRVMKSANACCSIRACPGRRASFSSRHARREARGHARASPAAARARASCSPCRRRRRGRARAPAARRRPRGRSGTRRRSRPRSRSRRARAARRAARRGARALSTTPVGCWCAGVTITASARRARARRPQPVARRPRRHGLEAGALGDLAVVGVARVLDARSASRRGSQRAADEAEPLRVAAGDDHAPGSATTPRTRPRYSASAARSASTPRGSP